MLEKWIEKSSGTTVAILNKSLTEELLFPLPPIEEQKEIVHILESVLDRENRVSELLSLMESISLLEKVYLIRLVEGRYSLIKWIK